MGRSIQFVAVTFWLLAADGATLGAIQAVWQRIPITPAAIDDDPQLATMQCWDLMVTKDGIGRWPGCAQRCRMEVTGGFPEGEPLSLGDSTCALPGTFSMRWGDLCTDLPGTYQIARVTFPVGVLRNVINVADVGAQGPFSFTAQVTPDSVVEIPDIPEPASLSVIVLSAVGIAAQRRRNRHTPSCHSSARLPKRDES